MRSSFESTDYTTDFTPIEEYIRRARIERSVALAGMISDALAAATRGLKKGGQAIAATIKAARDARSVESDAYLRWPPARS